MPHSSDIIATFIKDRAPFFPDPRALFRDLAENGNCREVTVIDLALAALQLAINLTTENEELMRELDALEEEIEDIA